MNPVIDRLRRAAEAENRGVTFDHCLPLPLEHPGGGLQREAAEALGVKAETTKIAVHRLRRCCRSTLLAEVAETVGSRTGTQGLPRNGAFCSVSGVAETVGSRTGTQEEIRNLLEHSPVRNRVTPETAAPGWGDSETGELREPKRVPSAVRSRDRPRCLARRTMAALSAWPRTRRMGDEFVRRPAMK
jgi:hypothetical protein